MELTIVTLTLVQAGIDPLNRKIAIPENEVRSLLEAFVAQVRWAGATAAVDFRNSPNATQIIAVNCV